ncbi:MAG: hypothetical protein K0R11_1664, partial [Acidimicrobiales bacterium]|nr:hypothetical protein [Acidimicrobiales bacterium]
MRGRLAAVAAALAAVLAACGDDGGGETSSEPSARSVTTSTTAPADPPTTAPVSLDEVRVALEEVAVLDAPIALVQRPGFDELVVAERGGAVRVLGDDGPGAPIVDISDQTTTDGERGLLGIAFSPDG